MLNRKRSGSVYGSRLLVYDVPLPIDECQTEDVVMRSHHHQRRRGSSTRRRQRPGSLASGTSSRLSGISNSSAEFQRSLLTMSCSSGGSCASSNITMEMAQAAATANSTQSWQPQTLSVPSKKPVTRNVSSPPNLTQFKQQAEQQKQQHQPTVANQQSNQCNNSNSNNDAALVADLVKTKSWMRTNSVAGNFQQFLHRMSNRRSNKPIRPISACNSIK